MTKSLDEIAKQLRVWGSDLFCIGKEKKIWGEKMRRG